MFITTVCFLFLLKCLTTKVLSFRGKVLTVVVVAAVYRSQNVVKSMSCFRSKMPACTNVQKNVLALGTGHYLSPGVGRGGEGRRILEGSLDFKVGRHCRIPIPILAPKRTGGSDCSNCTGFALVII